MKLQSQGVPVTSLIPIDTDRLIVVIDDEILVSIVVEISKRGAATNPHFGQAPFSADVFKTEFAGVAIGDVGLIEWVAIT